MNTLNDFFTESNICRVRNIYLYAEDNATLQSSLANFRNNLLNAGYQEDQIFLLFWAGKILSQELI